MYQESEMRRDELLPVLVQEGDLAVVSVDGQPVVTARALAKVLGYTSEKAILMMVSRNTESFREPERGYQSVTPFDTTVIELKTAGGTQEVRVFTKRGALKICMKSNQPRAVQVQEMLIDLYEAVESRRLVPVEALQEVQRRLDGLSQEVRRLAEAQEQKVIYLPRAFRPRATDVAATEFLRGLFIKDPRQKTAQAIRKLEERALEEGWKLGSKASLYRLVKKVN